MDLSFSFCFGPSKLGAIDLTSAALYGQSTAKQYSGPSDHPKLKEDAKILNAAKSHDTWLTKKQEAWPNRKTLEETQLSWTKATVWPWPYRIDGQQSSWEKAVPALAVQQKMEAQWLHSPSHAKAWLRTTSWKSSETFCRNIVGAGARKMADGLFFKKWLLHCFLNIDSVSKALSTQGRVKILAYATRLLMGSHKAKSKH